MPEIDGAQYFYEGIESTLPRLRCSDTYYSRCRSVLQHSTARCLPHYHEYTIVLQHSGTVFAYFPPAPEAVTGGTTLRHRRRGQKEQRCGHKGWE
ncbi:hypothetical protein E2C01_080138 [Portunus trituberculatus]|uniref:Uncharacterized protein n=1 Tax=Portunus trituberculatus TaxID=210409 RepID=A0A5B7IV76_PORTR|nr:hypothetical protein [Portunus trituberculatus]